MKTAGAIVTSRGGRTCHAAIVARELGVPAVVGAERRGRETRDRHDGDGELRRRRGRHASTTASSRSRRPVSADRTVPRPKTKIMVNLGNPELAFHTAMLPNDGVGLARMEFIISEHIGVHPMALVHPERSPSAKARAAIARLTRNYPQPTDFFVERLSEGVGTIAAAFYPEAGHRAAVRFQDQRICQPARRRRVRAEGG